MSPTRRKATILVVDDEVDLLEAIKIMLEDVGHTVVTASTGEEVAQEIEQGRVDLVLLDVLLSGYDGREIARSLRQSPAGHSVPIIIMTAHPRAQHLVEEYGIDDVITKPFEIDTVLNKVQKYLQTTAL